jgi:hypothetical protein
MSAMQKAIRRGLEDLALSAAATLLRDAPDKLWRRIGCIACEDVDLAALDTVGIATVSLGGKQARVALRGEWAVASCVVAELSRAPKCRAADDLLMACQLHPAYADARVRSSLAPRRGDPPVVFGQLCEAGWPPTIVEVAREGFPLRAVTCTRVFKRERASPAFGHDRTQEPYELHAASDRLPHLGQMR